MELLTVFEWFTVVVTILVMTSGLPVCVKMYKTSSTKGVPYTLFLVYAFVSTLCIQYGSHTKNTALILVNVLALLVWVGYISIYFLVTTAKTDAFMKASAILFMYWAHLQYLTVLPAENVLPTLGNYVVFWCTMLAVIPCFDIVDMVKTKSSASCDMNMLYATTLNACTWIVYGFMLNDVYIWLPSLPALIVNVVKFALIFAYSTSESKKSVKKTKSKKEVMNGGIATDFHEHVYRVKARNSLRKGIQ